MALAVVGSRTFKDFNLLLQTLDKFREAREIHTIVSGGAAGADRLAERYAAKRQLKTLIFEPDWVKYGRAAGIIRNKDIVAAADYVVAFWDGESKGTRNSIEHAKKMKKELIVVQFEG